MTYENEQSMAKKYVFAAIKILSFLTKFVRFFFGSQFKVLEDPTPPCYHLHRRICLVLNFVKPLITLVVFEYLNCFCVMCFEFCQ